MAWNQTTVLGNNPKTQKQAMNISKISNMVNEMVQHYQIAFWVRFKMLLTYKLHQTGKIFFNLSNQIYFKH